MEIINQHSQKLTCSVNKMKEKIPKLFVKSADFLLEDEICPVTYVKPNQITCF